MNLDHLYVAGKDVTQSEMTLLRKLESNVRPMMYFGLCSDSELNRQLAIQPCDVIMAAHIHGLIRIRRHIFIELTQRGKDALHYSTVHTQLEGLPS